jgi:hypothetical protein
MRQNDEKKKSNEDSTMLGRFSEPEEQAGAVVYFLSDYSTCKCFRLTL